MAFCSFCGGDCDAEFDRLEKREADLLARAEAAESDAALYRAALLEIAIDHYYDDGSFAYHDTWATTVARAVLEAKP